MASCPPNFVDPYFDPPPSYNEVTQSPQYLETAYRNIVTDGLTAIDFVSSGHGTRFSSFIKQANDWLKDNIRWQVRKCETVLFKSEVGIPVIQKMTYKGNTFVKGLRLWLTPRLYPHALPQQLGSFTVNPTIKDSKADTVEFEDVPCLLSKLNDYLNRTPVNGHILTVQTETVKVTKRSINSDEVLFTDQGIITSVLRVFYEFGKPAYETVGYFDFYPQPLPAKKPSQGTSYQPMPDLIEQAARWCSERIVNICNIQTFHAKIFSNNQPVVLRALRLFTLYSAYDTREIWPHLTVTNRLMSKTFLPVQLSDAVSLNKWKEPPTFETLQQTLKRINSWVIEHKVKIISMETSTVGMFSGDEGVEGPQTTVLTETNKSDMFHIWIIRVFVDGLYPDPPPNMCPPAFVHWGQIPLSQKTGSSTNMNNPDSCNIS